MVNFRDPAVVAHNERFRAKFWHLLLGVYLWEFFTTLDYEWKVFRGHIPYRWTIWIYSFTRVSTLLSALLCVVGIDSKVPIGDCQSWFSTLLVFSYLPMACASLLIVLRTNAIWNRNKAVMVTTIGLWVVNSAFLIQGTAQLRVVWRTDCEPINTTSIRLTYISIAITDIALLFIMLVGLLRLRDHGRCFGLTNLLWKQGVIWICLAAASEVPPTVFIFLNLNDQFNVMFQVPALLTMTIAATRLHRYLVDFASRSSGDTGHDNHQANGLAFSKTKRTSAMSIPIPVTVDIEHHPTPQTSLSSLSVDTDAEVHNIEGDV